VGEPIYASSALSNGVIYIRGEKHLYAIRERRLLAAGFRASEATASLADGVRTTVGSGVAARTSAETHTAGAGPDRRFSIARCAHAGNPRDSWRHAARRL